MASTVRAEAHLGGRRAWAVVVLVALAATQGGCAALRNEWSDKHGGPDVDGLVQDAVRAALPAATEVSVGSHKNGFSQEMDVGITLPGPSYDADDLLATARAVCDAVELTDVVYVEVTDGSARTRLDLAALAAEDLPQLGTPYEPTQVEIDVEDDCAGL